MRNIDVFIRVPFPTNSTPNMVTTSHSFSKVIQFSTSVPGSCIKIEASYLNHDGNIKITQGATVLANTMKTELR